MRSVCELYVCSLNKMCWEVAFSWIVAVHSSILIFRINFRADHGEPDTSCREAKTTKSSAKSSIYELVGCLHISLAVVLLLELLRTKRRKRLLWLPKGIWDRI